MVYLFHRQKIGKRWSENSRSFLDAIFYTNSSLIPIEQKQIFQKTWLYFGHISKIAEPGQVMTSEVAGRSIVLTRTKAGELKAFYNVCSHRAARLITESGVSRKKCFVCPYHGWVFDLDGQLMATPMREEFPEALEFEKFPLQPIRVEVWETMIFVCLDDDAPNLSTFLGESFQVTTDYPLANMQLLFERESVVACNWKTFHDNSLCDYHVSFAHRETLKDIQGPAEHYQYKFDEYVNTLTTPITDLWKEDNKVYKGIPEACQSKFFTFGIFPNLHIYILPDASMFLERIDPLTVDTCRVRTEVYGIPGYYPDLEELKPWYEKLFLEDQALTEGVQAGYTSGSYRSGLPNNLEARMIHQQQLIRRYLLQHLNTNGDLQNNTNPQLSSDRFCST